MVHALREAWRVLIPRGVMIDLRPLCLDASVDILYKGELEFAGTADMSLDIKSEIASNRAIDTVLSEKYYKELASERFEIAYYWDTVRGMMADMRNRWKDDVMIEESVIRRAYQLFGKHRGPKKARFLIQMKLAKYGKLK